MAQHLFNYDQANGLALGPVAFAAVDNAPGHSSGIFLLGGFPQGKEEFLIEFDALATSAANHDLRVQVFGCQDGTNVDRTKWDEWIVANANAGSIYETLHIQGCPFRWVQIVLKSTGTDTWSGNYSVRRRWGAEQKVS